jgi:hypothetical protein
VEASAAFDLRVGGALAGVGPPRSEPRQRIGVTPGSNLRLQAT